jgi:hypothetical protein
MEHRPETMMQPQESLQLITDMINKAKSNYHDSGTSAILWGSVIGLCGIVSHLNDSFKWKLPFDIWILAILALIPQIIIGIRERRSKIVKRAEDVAIDAVWLVYGITIFCLIAYVNIIAFTSKDLLTATDKQLLIKTISTGNVDEFLYYPPSFNSLLMIAYAFPTMVTGIVKKFKPMIIGAIVCYCFFVLSLFTPTNIDTLLNGLSAIFNWLIPGLILRQRYLAQQKASNV